MGYAHAPVMVHSVMHYLRPEAGKRYLDGTLGGGGHAEKLLEQSAPDGLVLGLDRDAAATTRAGEQLSRFGERLLIRRANFRDAKQILKEISWDKVDGILLDLGVSSEQLDSPDRGFSFRLPARLDMRMDPRQPLDAHRIVNAFPAAELERILSRYGEEPHARRIARAIDSARRVRPIDTTTELAAIVERATPARRKARAPRIHAATRTFQALRIAVNHELENLEAFLADGYELLGSQARMVIISFHSLEDRLVKNAFRRWSLSCICPPRIPVCRCGWSRKARVLTPRPLRPSPEEVAENPRARAAKLRAVEAL